MAKSVLVTGGARRLGALICQQFAKDGWQVWCHAQRSVAEAQALCAHIMAAGGQARTVQADLASETDRQQMMAHIAAESGP